MATLDSASTATGPGIPGEAPTCLRPCPVCGNTEAHALKTLSLPQASGSPLPGGYRLMACQACDLVFAETPAPQSAYDLYYQRCAKYGGPTGTGAGLHSAGQARGLRLREGLIHEAATRCAGERYDLIVLSHVAEHLRDLRSLPDLARLLTPEGKLYIEVPHPAGYACGERPPYYYFDSEHINHFSAQALARLLAPAGLQLHSAEAVSLTLSDGGHYPALAVVAGQGAAPPVSAQPSTVRAVQRYLADCAQGATLVPQPPLPAQGPVLAWGAGSWAQRLLGQGRLPRDRLVAFLDNDPNKQGLQLDGLPIVPPTLGLQQHPQAAILVCVAIDPQQIAAALDALDPEARQRLHFLSHPL